MQTEELVPICIDTEFNNLSSSLKDSCLLNSLLNYFLRRVEYGKGCKEQQEGILQIHEQQKEA